MAHNYKGQPKRRLTDEDIDGWLKAPYEPPRQPRGKKQVMAHVRSRNAIRLWRLQRDFKWLQKEMKRMGLNPEDARFML